MKETRLVEVRYIGRVKDRADGTQTAYGWCNNAWSVSFTKSALYNWFGMSERPGEAGSLYSTLGIAQAATADEVKKAYRRMAKQWHPDICRETDARKQFDAIQHAYDILSGDKRRKYDAGLALQASLAASHQGGQAVDDKFGYRSPLRCGWILGEGTSTRGKFTFEKILQWQDIFRGDGRMLVVSWVYGDDKPTEDWVIP